MNLPPMPRIERSANAISLRQRRFGWGERTWILLMRQSRSAGWRSEWYNDGEVAYWHLSWGKPRRQSRLAFSIYFYLRSA